MTITSFRNVAIVAHVDHGKTTLVDAMLRQSGAFEERAELVDRVMDSGDLEREKGITILAKNTAVHKVNEDGSITVINVIDTPRPRRLRWRGRARACPWSTASVLLVDASEGPLPQTRFVLRKALAASLPVILVVNKTDRPDARIEEVVTEAQDLLLDLASDLSDEAAEAAELALELPVLYASGREGKASTVQPENGKAPDAEDLTALFQVLMEYVPSAEGLGRRTAAGSRHQPRRIRIPRSPRTRSHPQRRAAQGPDRVLVPARSTASPSSRRPRSPNSSRPSVSSAFPVRSPSPVTSAPSQDSRTS